jgi:Putative DNA-binding domain
MTAKSAAVSLALATHDRRVGENVWITDRAGPVRRGPIPPPIEWDSGMPPPWVASDAGVRRHAGATRRAYAARRVNGAEVVMSDLAQIQRAFAQAIRDPDARVSALRTQFPVVEQLVGAEFFRVMARDYVAEEPPRSPALLDYGSTFPAFIDRYTPAKPVPYLADVARIELARGLAYHSADVTPVDRAAFAALPHGRLHDIRLRLHPSVSIVTSQHPAFSIWRVNQNPDRVTPISPWAPEAALIARPFLRVETRLVSAGIARFIAELIDGATLGAAFAAGAEASAKFDSREALALLIASDIVVGFDRNVAQPRPTPITA